MKKLLMVIGLVIAIGVTGCTAAAAEDETEAVEVIQEPSVAIEYIELFLNGSDKEKQKEFLNEKIYADSKPLYEFIIGLGGFKTKPYNEPKVIESFELEDKGKIYEYTLITATDEDGEKEIIIATAEGKFVVALSPSEKDKEIYDTVRSKFKTPTN